MIFCTKLFLWRKNVFFFAQISSVNDQKYCRRGPFTFVQHRPEVWAKARQMACDRWDIIPPQKHILLPAYQARSPHMAQIQSCATVSLYGLQGRYTPHEEFFRQIRRVPLTVVTPESSTRVPFTGS